MKAQDSTESDYRIWSNNIRGYYAKCEIEGGILVLLKSSLIEMAEYSYVVLKGNKGN